jgi:hypothetical protein
MDFKKIFRKNKETDVYKKVNESILKAVPTLKNETPLFNFNLGEDGMITKGTVAIADGFLYTLQEENEAVKSYALSEIEKIYVREYYGSVAVEATINAKEKELFRTTLSLSDDIKRMADIFASEGFDLFPGGKLSPGKYDVTTACSCPDYANPCKHVTAVLLLLGEEIASHPLTLLELRGILPSELCDED